MPLNIPVNKLKLKTFIAEYTEDLDEKFDNWAKSEPASTIIEKVITAHDPEDFIIHIFYSTLETKGPYR